MSAKGKRINVYVESEKIDLIYKFQEKVKENGRASSSKVIVEFMEDYVYGS